MFRISDPASGINPVKNICIFRGYILIPGSLESDSHLRPPVAIRKASPEVRANHAFAAGNEPPQPDHGANGALAWVPHGHRLP